ncbi:MAG: TetR family transcriptional regulator [Patulibacter minatonensis]
MADSTPSQGVYRVGQQTRRAILDAAAAAFAARGIAASKSEIAEDAGVLPSQVGYYFGTKEALFVEAACREVLHLASAVEQAAVRARSPRAYVRALVAAALESPALPFFAEATLLVRAHPAQRERVAETFDRLHAEGERAVAANFAARGWNLRAPAAHQPRAFWAVVLGCSLEGLARGASIGPAAVERSVDLVYELYVDPAAEPAGA